MRGQDNKDLFSSFSDFPFGAFCSEFHSSFFFHESNLCVGSYKIITRISRFRCPPAREAFPHRDQKN